MGTAEGARHGLARGSLRPLRELRVCARSPDAGPLGGSGRGRTGRLLAALEERVRVRPRPRGIPDLALRHYPEPVSRQAATPPDALRFRAAPRLRPWIGGARPGAGGHTGGAPEACGGGVSGASRAAAASPGNGFLQRPHAPRDRGAPERASGDGEEPDQDGHGQAQGQLAKLRGVVMAVKQGHEEYLELAAIYALGALA